MVPNEERVSNEKKNLNRLAGEFLVASRLTQRGYMVALQWGNTIGYDVLVFDKAEKVAYLEVKSTASNPKRWILQAKYAHPERDAIRLDRRFVCCVDLTVSQTAPHVYVFPAQVVAKRPPLFLCPGLLQEPELHARPERKASPAYWRGWNCNRRRAYRSRQVSRSVRFA
jgi:hypothetical protein